MRNYKLVFGKKFSLRKLRYKNYWKIIADNGELICTSTPSQAFYNMSECEDNAKLTGLAISEHFKL